MRHFFPLLLAALLLGGCHPDRAIRSIRAPVAAFGPAAATLPLEWLSRGVILDRDGAEILRQVIKGHLKNDCVNNDRTAK